MVEVKIGTGVQTQWRITVSDSGHGITPDNLQYLFQPFNRLNFGQSQIEGTGIGLVISKNFVEAMGGTIGVKSFPDKGSQFWIELPTVGAPDPVLKAAKPTPAIIQDECKNSPGPAEHSNRILAVEDSTTNQALLYKQLQLLHYEVDMASNGMEALDFLSQRTYKLVLTDCNMPKINGFQLTEIIRQQENGQNRHIPILAITANAVSGEAERCYRAGMDEYLAKPVRLDQLQAKIEKYQGHSRNSEHPLFATHVENADRQAQLDITVLQSTLGDQPQNHRQVLRIFSQSAPSTVEEILQAVSLQDHEALHTAAHKLKSAARAIGARVLAAICQLLETNSYDKDWKKISTLSAQLTTAMTQVEAAIADHT